MQAPSVSELLQELEREKGRASPQEPASDDCCMDYDVRWDDEEPELVMATREAFSRAVTRVAFAVIGNDTEVLAHGGAINLSAAVARAVARVLMDERFMQVDQVEHLRFDAGDMGKIKAAAKGFLTDAYQLGLKHSTNELMQIRPAFTSTRGIAADWIEANGARMAGNIADGARAIITQDILNGIKFGWSPEQTRDSILKRLAKKGFALLADLIIELKARGGDTTVTPEGSLPAYIMTLARTNIFEAMNEARFAVFTDPGLEGFVVAMEYSPILDDRTTAICTELDGFTRVADDPIWDEYRPPNHWNCRSVLVPITRVDGWDGQTSPDPSVEPQEGFGGDFRID